MHMKADCVIFMLREDLFLCDLRYRSLFIHRHMYDSESEIAQSYPSPCNPMDSSLHQNPPSTGFYKVRVRVRVRVKG